MIENPTDLRFFTNHPDETLYDRFVATLKDVRYFDLLVGYFRTSGFKRLAANLKDTEKIRILVGLSIDQQAYVSLQKVEGIDFESGQRTKETFVRNLKEEMATSEDSEDVSDSAESLVDFLRSGKLEMRAYPGRNLHAKVYISRFKETDRDYGRVITGSSNFSENGLVGQREFNVELKDRPDVAYALEKFEELWAKSIDISEEYVDTITNHTWLNDKVTPFDLYLKFLYEYFKEDLSAASEEEETFLPDGFMDLEYQRQAVTNARKILDSYGGVFLADVVGLGKTYITARLLQTLGGRKLILCPPVLMEYWRETLRDFYVPGFKVESLGKIDQVAKEPDLDKYQVIVIDEAHRFRNDETSTYGDLHTICRGKKVVLVSATPLNNRVSDIGSLLKLFQPARRSDIPGVRNLENFFGERQRLIEAAKRSDPEQVPALMTHVSEEVREKVLKHVMVRRTRSEIKKYFQEDMEKQGLSFPDIADPERIVYTFDDATEAVFNRTIERLKDLHYARYTPLLYLKKGVTGQERQGQRNIGGFMKSIYVKRLESSKYAFTRTIGRSIESYQAFIGMLDEGEVHLGKNVNIFDLLDEDNTDRLLDLQAQGRITTYESGEFASDFRKHLEEDLATLQAIQKDWRTVQSDAKLEEFKHELRVNPLLRDRKVIVFTESLETAEYLYENVQDVRGNRAYLYSSDGGRHGSETHGKKTAQAFIEDNFDPRSKSQQDAVDLLIATDILAEGMNLHRANVIVNYDLPWNPTRVLQRVGRVNRVGTEHALIHIFNFFPTSISDEHLGLEENITNKIKAFHNVLGEDAKYLTEEEEVGTFELFGDRLFNTLNDRESYEGDEEEETDLGYYQFIRKVRDEQPEVFERIKHLPRKARSARANTLIAPDEGLVTFFRKGKLKKFVLARDTETLDLTFLDAARLMACEEDEPRRRIPKKYFALLDRNRRFFTDVTASEDAPQRGPASSSSEMKVIKVLRSPLMRQPSFTDEDDDLVQNAIAALYDGRFPRAVVKALWKDIQKATTDEPTPTLDPMKILTAVKKHLDGPLLRERPGTSDDEQPREVILSAYLIGDA